MSWFSLGFLNPLWLALIPVATGLLVFAYLRRGKGRQVVVGTLFLLRALKRPTFSRKKFRPPLRFYLELLLLLLLSIGAAGLYKQGMGTRIAVLVDNSFSMAQLNPGDSSAADILSVAKRDAASLLSSLSSESKVELYVSSPHMLSLSGSLVRPDRAIEDLKRVELAYAADNLEAGIQKLVGDPTYERVFVFSDRKPQNRDSGGRLDFRTAAAEGSRPQAENVAIAHLTLRSGSPKNSVEVSLASFLQGQSKVKIILESVELEGRTASYKKIAEKSVVLKGRSHEIVVFPDISPVLRAFRARLEPDQQGLSIDSDSIRQDDSAVLSVEAHGGTIALVSQFSPADLGLGNLRFAQFQHIRPEDYEKDPGLILKKSFSAAIFHRYVPQKLPNVSSVFIAPVSSSEFFNLGTVVKDVELTRWLGTHAALNYVNMASLKLAKANVISAPPWAEELISSTSGAIAFAGETEQHKYVGIGFELLPFEGKKSTLTSILTLNILKFISDIGADVGFQTVGSKVFLPADARRAYYLDGDELLVKGANSQLESGLVAPKPGIVAVESDLSGSALNAFNYYDENESDTLSSEPLSVDVPKADPIERRDTSLLAGWIAGVVAIILLLDLVFASGFINRFKSSGGAA